MTAWKSLGNSNLTTSILFKYCVCLCKNASIILNIMFYALMGRFHFELLYLFFHRRPIHKLFFPVGLSSLTRHFYQALYFLLSPVFPEESTSLIFGEGFQKSFALIVKQEHMDCCCNRWFFAEDRPLLPKSPITPRSSIDNEKGLLKMSKN